MTKLITILVITFSLISCRQIKAENKVQHKSINTLEIDTSKIAILPFETSQYWVFKNCKPAELNSSDLKSIDTILQECIDNYNPKKEKEFNESKKQSPNQRFEIKHFTIDLTRYKRQYVAVTNEKGEKEVWVNCFCTTFNQDWKKVLIFVKDGGNCFFNLKINLTTGKYYELMVNGEA